MKNWIAIYSQTGSEIEEISNYIGRWPTFIFSDRDDDRRSEIMKMRTGIYPKGKIEENIILNKDALITLHGYLRIVSEDTCKQHDSIYNGHPGLITKYPELKGKDPQKKILQSDKEYDIIGSVIHKVIPEVDSGEVVLQRYVKNVWKTSMNCWIDFFKNKELCE